MLTSLVTGLVACAALIVVIGAQNAFVLRQGLARRHITVVVVICVLSDVVLLSAGVLGLGAVVQAFPVVAEVARWAGAAFLLAYAVLAARRAIVGSQGQRIDARSAGRRQVVLTCLAFTWLNPHVYLDTVLVLGGLATSHGPVGQWWFVAGTALGSLVWFTLLGFGARVLAPLFARPAAWRVLDATVAIMMLGLAVSLALTDLSAS